MTPLNSLATSSLAKRAAVIALLTTTLFGGIFGIATAINLTGVDSIGAGEADIAPPPDVVDVQYVLHYQAYPPPTYTDWDNDICQVELVFAGAIPVDTEILVELTDEVGDTVSLPSYPDRTKVVDDADDLLDGVDDEVVAAGTKITVEMDNVDPSVVYDIRVTTIMPQ